MLNSAVILRSGDVYLDVIPAGSKVPAHAETRFPVDPNAGTAFYMGIGQMLNPFADGMEYDEFFEVVIDQFPRIARPTLYVCVQTQVDESNDLYVWVGFSPDETGSEFLEESMMYGPYPLD